MNRFSKGVIAAGLGSLVVSFTVPAPAEAKSSAPTCYGQPTERISLGAPEGSVEASDVRESGDIQVTVGSPCRDVNVRQVQVRGKAKCLRLRVVWQDSGETGAWVRTCKPWRVLAHGAVEGRVYRIQAQGRDALVRVGVRG